MEQAIKHTGMEKERMEKERILRRYRDNPLFDDTDLYYNGLIDATEFLDHRFEDKEAVYNTLMSRLSEHKEPEKEAFKKIPSPFNYPKNKRSRRIMIKTTNLMKLTVFQAPKTVVVSGLSVKKRMANEERECEGTTGYKKRRKNANVLPPVNMIQMTPALRACLQKDGVKFVIEKNLTNTDVNDGNNRLSIPESQIRDRDFLTEEEVSWMEKKDGEKRRHYEVKLIDTSGTKYDISLSRWTMKETVVYNLVSPWNQVVAANKLRVNNLIRLYSYREGSKLFFVLFKF